MIVRKQENNCLIAGKLCHSSVGIEIAMDACFFKSGIGNISHSKMRDYIPCNATFIPLIHSWYATYYRDIIDH